MATDSKHGTVDAPGVFDPRLRWKAGILSGAVASIVMGVLIVFTGSNELGLIAGLYGAPQTVGASAVVHVFHGVLFGLLFAAIQSDPALHHATDRPVKGTLVGTVFGIVLGIVGAGLILPMWVQSIGLDSTMTVPHITPLVLGWHIVYGAVLGLLFSGTTGEHRLF